MNCIKKKKPPTTLWNRAIFKPLMEFRVTEFRGRGHDALYVQVVLGVK